MRSKDWHETGNPVEFTEEHLIDPTDESTKLKFWDDSLTEPKNVIIKKNWHNINQEVFITKNAIYVDGKEVHIFFKRSDKDAIKKRKQQEDYKREY